MAIKDLAAEIWEPSKGVGSPGWSAALFTFEWSLGNPAPGQQGAMVDWRLEVLP